MAATKTVSQTIPVRKTRAGSQRPEIISKRNELRISPRNGVITLYGYGINVSVDRGHLILKDGVGPERGAGRFPRVNHGIRRVVVIGSDGFVSLAAIRWLADQNASFVMLDRDGSVLIATGPVAASDARLRRAQACIHETEAAVSIARELIASKLAGQERIARDKLGNAGAAASIAKYARELPNASSVAEVRSIEAQAASVYWFAWRDLKIDFSRTDLAKMPDHWLTFGPRTSPLSNGARSATNPANAMLNYLYTVLETETRLTIAAIGLDPGLGVLHIDKKNRDSLACDLMEPVRPYVDEVLIDWLQQSPLKRDWFFEMRDGTSRLMPSIASRLGETALQWRKAIEPYAEWFANAVSATSPDSRVRGPGTRLTRRNWRQSMRRPESESANVEMPEAQSTGDVAVSTDGLMNQPTSGHELAHTPDAKQRHSENIRKQYASLRAWNPADQPEWLTPDYYASEIQPRLKRLTRPRIAEAIGVNLLWAGKIRNGKTVAHDRHWLKLAQLVGLVPESSKHAGSAPETDASVQAVEMVASPDPEWLVRRKEKTRRQNEANQAWDPAELPEWLTSEYYVSQIEPQLKRSTVQQIRDAIGISAGYGREVRNGERVPHPRHWLKLAILLQLAPTSSLQSLATAPDRH